MCFVGILVTTVVLWAVVTHLRTCYLPPPHLPQSHLQLEDTKCLATLKMHRNLQYITEVGPCTHQLHHTVPVSHHASPHTPTLWVPGHTSHTTPPCPRRLSPTSTTSPLCQTETGNVTENLGGVTVLGVLAREGCLTITSKT